MQEHLGPIPAVAENLGHITPDVEEVRLRFGFPGMAILQFAFGTDPQGPSFRPHNFVRNLVAYTGTHDNDTTVCWFNSVAGAGSTRTAEQVESEREFCMKYLNTKGEEIQWDFIRAVLASVANIAIVPLQDLLGLGTEARMNLPNSTSGNWMWRVLDGAVTEEHAEHLRALTQTYGRVPRREVELDQETK